jgi:hypothetical protein
MRETSDESELMATCRHCAALRKRMQDAALHSVPRQMVQAHAERLGLPVGEELAQIPDHELHFAFDLAIHTAPMGRSRPIDRLGRQYQGQEGSEATLVLRALQSTWFSVFRVIDSHPEAGLVLEDALLGGEAWVLDEALTENAAPGTILGLRVGRVRGFAMTTGVVACLDEAMLAGVRHTLAEANLPAAEMTADPRFALLIYRRALGIRLSDAFDGSD